MRRELAKNFATIRLYLFLVLPFVLLALLTACNPPRHEYNGRQTRASPPAPTAYYQTPPHADAGQPQPPSPHHPAVHGVTPYHYKTPDEATGNRLAGCAFPTYMPPTAVWCKSGT